MLTASAAAGWLFQSCRTHWGPIPIAPNSPVQWPHTHEHDAAYADDASALPCAWGPRAAPIAPIALEEACIASNYHRGHSPALVAQPAGHTITTKAGRAMARAAHPPAVVEQRLFFGARARGAGEGGRSADWREALSLTPTLPGAPGARSEARKRIADCLYGVVGAVRGWRGDRGMRAHIHCSGAAAWRSSGVVWAQRGKGRRSGMARPATSCVPGTPVVPTHPPVACALLCHRLDRPWTASTAAPLPAPPSTSRATCGRWGPTTSSTCACSRRCAA